MYAIVPVTTILAVSGPLAGVLIGWFLSTQSERPSLRTTAAQRQIDHICEIDRLVASAMGSLQTYEKRILVGQHLEQNGQTSTKEAASNSEPATNETSTTGPFPHRRSLREPLDGKTLLDIKRDADEDIWECANALTRATAFLDNNSVLRAQELVEALVATRETLEAQESGSVDPSEEMSEHVASLHRSRIRFLDTARKNLHGSSLSTDIAERVERLTEKAFSPSQVPRPYVATGVRLPEERL